MALIPSSYIANPGQTVGCPLIVTSPGTGISVTNTSPGLVFNATGSELVADPYDFLTTYPLLLKIFFYNVIMSGVVAYPNPEFVVNVTGPAGFTCHRIDEKNFSLAIRIADWANKSLATTVSVRPVPTLTGVSFTCIAGIAPDSLNRPERA